MKDFGFDIPVDRRGTESVKWDEFPGTLPLWVADMDFRTAPSVMEALRRRLEHGVFGYELVPQDYYDSISAWFSRRHGWKGIAKENIVYTTGVIAAYSAAIKAMTVPGDKVMVMTPCYNAFFPAIRNNRCVRRSVPLLYEGGRWSIDFDELEKAAGESRVLLLCNPHNPVGRVWTRDELLRVGEICLRHGVFVISDEIHCELTYPGHDYTPWATLERDMVLNSVSCISPTKAFNIAGIQIANIFAASPQVLAKMDRAINDNECCDVNVFGVAALKAAYNGGEQWLDALRAYLLDNAAAVYAFLGSRLPQVQASPLEGTYLMWLDCRAALCPGEPLEGFSARFGEHLRTRHGLTLSDGSIYGEDGEGFMRLNIACPRKLLMEAMEKFVKGYETYRYDV